MFRSRLAGAIIILAAAIALAVTLFTSYEQRSVVECQSNLNAQFLQSLKARAAIADADRDAIRVLVADLSEAKSTAESDRLLDVFNETQVKLDELRADNTYPSKTECS